MTRTVRAALDAARERLAAADVPAAEVDAALLLAHATGWSRTELRLRSGDALDDAAAERLDALVARRAAREPVQLLLGRVGFRHLDIAVRPGVFIPRPETEVLAGAAIERLRPGGLVAEPCTGTGAVACAVATEARCRVVATDLSPAAAALARENAMGTGARVEVMEGDLLAPLDPRLLGALDVLVSNPPYVADGELDGLEPEVLDWDPRDALVSGPTGHEVSDRLVAEGLRWLRPGGWLLLEVDASRAAETAARAASAGYAEASVLPDLAGRDRVVAARSR